MIFRRCRVINLAPGSILIEASAWREGALHPVERAVYEGVLRALSTLAQAHWLRWLLVAAVVLLYAGWSGYTVSRDKPGDFYLYYLAAGAFLRGQNAYALSGPAWNELAAEMGVPTYDPPYHYPPLTAVLIAPLTLLPPRPAAIFWLACSTITAVVAAWWLALASDTVYRWPLALGGLLGFVPALATLYNGQVNLFLFASLTLALWAMAQHRPVWLGIGLSVGTNLKVIPLALVGYLLWRWQWRALLAAAIGIILLLFLGLPLVGWEGLSSCGQKIFRLATLGGLDATPTNQTLGGFFGRLLTHHTYGWALTNNPALAYTLYRVAALLLVVTTVAVCWPAGNLHRLCSLEFALIVTAAHLIPPYTWYHQLVLLLIPFVVLATEVLHKPSLHWLLLPLTLGYIGTNLHGLLWHYLTGRTLLQSVPFYTMLMLWGLLAWLIVRRKWLSVTVERGAGVHLGGDDAW